MKTAAIAPGLLLIIAIGSSPGRCEPTPKRDQHAQRIEGLLIGTLLGDAAGGPVEFKTPNEVRHLLPATRDWPDDRKLTGSEIKKLADTFPLLSYAELRPAPGAYAHWEANAPPGTITDDSRQKIILINTLRRARQRNSFPVTREDFAHQYIRFVDTPAIQSRPHYKELCRENLREYVFAAHWVLGERDPVIALPPERLWAGEATCAGQMALLPIAALYPGDPETAYRAAYHIGFIDNGTAKELNAALVAGLAEALRTDLGPNQPALAWRHVLRTMSDVDPYRYNQVPWVPRPITHWLDFAHEAADRADKCPKRLFEILETEAKPVYWWDAHFLVVSSFALLEICDYDPLASMHLALDFGHDTDSTAQLIGAFAGALHGPEVFPKAMRNQVAKRLEADYQESLREWVVSLDTLSKKRGDTPIIEIAVSEPEAKPAQR